MCRPVTFSFESGHCYVIGERWSGGRNRIDMNPSSGKNCVFRYNGRQGIHHCFTETSGGWSRTYTDQQLIGKDIKEVVDG